MRKKSRRVLVLVRIGLAFLALCIFGLLSSYRGQIRGAEEQKSAYRVWPSQPPSDCPFPKSTDITGVGFTGKHIRYGDADTWYPSWAANGNLYSPWTDGTVNNIKSSSFGAKATTGYATVIGDDPLHLKVTDVGVYPGNPAPYEGRYPCGSLVYNGVWYYGTYCLLDSDGDPGKGLNWDILGPFVGFRYSTDYGKTWHDTPHTPAAPLFGEPAKPGGVVKMGSPHFVDFGKNMQYSPDGYAYLVGQGATDPDPKPRPANLSWITGDQIYMARVKPGIQNMNNRAMYEFFGGYDASGHPLWTHDFSKIKPLVDWNNNCGCVTMTYVAALKRYLMCITDGGNTISKFNTYIVESEHVAGPWKLVVYMHEFGEQGYFVNIPSKFISADGRTAWLCYATNFSNGNPNWNTHYRDIPPGGGYGMNLQEIKLLH
ncbi:MAG: hypothetical protein ABSG32_17010 [Terriglobia bacterium]|jgi:hypothetical protein